MLEPLFRCNLACAGCGKIQYPAEILKKQRAEYETYLRYGRDTVNWAIYLFRVS